MKYISQIYNIALRELDILRKNRIYGFCMLIFPALLVVFFTTMLDDGVALDLPVGVVDQDNSAMSRGLTRNLDAMQSSRVVYRFAKGEKVNVDDPSKIYAITSDNFIKLPYKDGGQKWVFAVTALDRLQNESRVVKKSVKL